jgi:hypothetical protein
LAFKKAKTGLILAIFESVCQKDHNLANWPFLKLPMAKSGLFLFFGPCNPDIEYQLVGGGG